MQKTDLEQRVGLNIPELDGIRGIAILLVLMFHLNGLSPANAGPFGMAALAVYSKGFIGVQLFFVLSGFLITGILLDTLETPQYFTSFYARRALRIFPLYYVFLLFYFHMLVPAAHYLHAWREIGGERELWYWLYLTNYLNATGHLYMNIGHLWSLAVEEQFYLIWPLIVFFRGRIGTLWVAVTLIAWAAVLRWIWQDGPNSSAVIAYMTPMQMDSLAFGALAAALLRGPAHSNVLARWCGKLAVASAGITIAFFFGLLPAIPTTFFYTSLGLCFACCITYCAMFSGGSDRICAWMRTPWIRRIGKYSYCIYVVHLLLGYFVIRAENKLLRRLDPSFAVPLSICAIIVGSAASYVVARISWALLEKPLLDLKSRFAYVIAQPASPAPLAAKAAAGGR